MQVEQLEGRQLLSALVHTDAVDYAPGAVAVFTALNDTNPGPNFQAGETINFHIARTDGVPVNSPPAVQDWSVIDGPDGTASTSWNVDSQFAGASLTVTATGVLSGATASANFTDSSLNAKLVVTPTSPHVGDVVTFDSHTSTVPGGFNITSYEWSFGDGNTYTELATNPGDGSFDGMTTHVYHAADTVTVSFTVTATNPHSGEQHTDATVAQTITQSVVVIPPVIIAPPVPSLVVTPNPATAGQAATFDSSATTAAPGQTVTNYQWIFGDGTMYTENTTSAPDGAFNGQTTHVYASAGTYHVQLNVISTGPSSPPVATLFQDVAVNAPVVSVTTLTASPGPYTYGDNITFTANTTHTDDGSATDFYDISSGRDLGWVAVIQGRAIFGTLDYGSILYAGANVIRATHYGGNGSVSYAEMTVNIDRRPVTGVFTTADKTYDGTTAAVYGNLGLNNAVVGDSIELDANGAVFSDVNAGTHAVSLTGARLSGTDNANYMLVGTDSVTATITPAELNIYTSDSTKVYDGTTDVTDNATPTFTGLLGSDTVTGLSESFYFPNAGAVPIVINPGFTVNDGNGGGNYQVYTHDRIGAITPKELTWSFAARDKTYDGSTWVETTSGNLAGVLPGDEVFQDAGVASFSDKNVGQNKLVTMDSLELIGADAANYTVNATATTTASITPRFTTGSFTVAGKVYDGTTTATLLTTNLNHVEGTDDVHLTGGTTYFTYPDAGLRTALLVGAQLTGADASNYSLNGMVWASATITKADATFDFQPINTTYDGNAHIATGSATGVDGELLSGLDLGATQRTNAGSSTDAWTFSDVNGNYNDANGSLVDTITPATATVSVTAIPGLVYNGAAQETASYSATDVNGNSLPGSDFTDTTVHADAGTYTDTWTFSDPNYVTQTDSVTSTIGQANVTVHLSRYCVYYDANPHSLTGVAKAADGTDLSSDLTFSSGTHTNAGAYQDTWTFTDPNGNYAHQSGQVQDNIVQASLIITATSDSKVYDGTTAVLDGTKPTVSGLQGSDTVTGLSEYFASPNAADRVYLVPNADFTVNDGNGGNNYTTQRFCWSGTITKADPIINVTNYDVNYDGLVHIATGTATGVDGALLGGLDLSGTQHTNATDGTTPDTWSFTDQTGNYNDLNGQFFGDRVEKIDLTLVALDKYKTYDGSPAGFGPVDVYAFGFVHGESLGNTSGDAGFAGSAVGAVNAGSYTITPTVGTLTATNYNFTTFVDGTLTIDKAAMPTSVKVLPYSVTYDGNVHTATGVNPVGDLDLTMTEHTNAGSYTDTVFFHGGQNYEDAQWTVVDTITQAHASIVVTPYNVTYDGNMHSANGTVTPSVGSLSITSDHTNAGSYHDYWTFVDHDGNYAPQAGMMTDVIKQANATVKITPYSVNYDAVVHNAPGTATGVKGETLTGLTISSAHTNAGTYADSYAFNDATGNYATANGKFTDTINKVNAKISVAPYSVVYNGVVHNATDTVTGVDGKALTGLTINSAHTNAGTYADNYTFSDPTGNYLGTTGKFTDVINKANVTVKVAPYNVVYNGAWHAATGSVAGVNGKALAGLNLGYTAHINAGVYRDAWYFTDSTGNYNSTSGLVTDVINKANARIVVNAYNVLFDTGAHASTGVAIGVYGEALPGLNLGSTVHVGGYYTNTFYDRWTFTDTTGNYNSTSGTVVNVIQGNPNLYRAVFKPFCPKSPFYNRLFIW